MHRKNTPVTLALSLAAAALLFALAPAPAQACGSYGSPEEMAEMYLEWSLDSLAYSAQRGDIGAMMAEAPWTLVRVAQLAENRDAIADADAEVAAAQLP